MMLIDKSDENDDILKFIQAYLFSQSKYILQYN